MSSRRLPRWLASPLVTAQLVGVFMLLRSVAFDRWMTVLVSLALVVGARAATRGRSWGLFVAFASAAWYLSVFLLGIAAPMFVPFAVLAALPLLKAWRVLAHEDRGAARVAVALAAGAGGLGAYGWKAAYPWLTDLFPALEGTAYASHGAALLAILGTAIVVGVRDRRAAAATAPDEARVRIAADLEESHDEQELDFELEEPTRARRGL